jgi:hypothetical protein
MFNYYYDFLYVPVYNNRISSGSTSSITLNNADQSFYSYEFLVDERNLGGTIHLDMESRLMVEEPYARSNRCESHCSSRWYHPI